MRLTADVLLRAEQYINACREREIALRGFKIPAIENVSVLEDQFDVIDITDNEIKKLDNFPVMNRLTTILASNNYISKVGVNLNESLKAVTTIVLSNNRIASLAEIDNLGCISTLQHLSLLENPVCQQAHYRLYAIYRIPSLKSLDFKKVEQREREEAKRFFQGSAGQQVIGAASTATVSSGARPVLSAAQKQQVRAAIEAASTREEIDAIERQLKSGTFQFQVEEEVAAVTAAEA